MRTNTSERSAAAGDPPVRDDPPRRVKVGIADYAVVDGDAVLATSGLGSCLGIALFDERNGVAGLLHAMLPGADEGSPAASAAKFVDTGLDSLVEAMTDAGASPRNIAAKMVGGSTMLDLTPTEEGSIGDRNVAAARAAFEERGISVVAEDTGGEYGRSLLFDTGSYELSVKTAYKGDSVI